MDEHGRKRPCLSPPPYPILNTEEPASVKRPQSHLLIHRASVRARPARLRTPQLRDREQLAGPLTTRLSLYFYMRGTKRYQLVERPYVITTRTPAALAHLRTKLHELMVELDGWTEDTPNGLDTPAPSNPSTPSALSAPSTTL